MSRKPHALPEEELHLWTLTYDPEDQELLGAAKLLLPQEELERFSRLKFPKSRAERIISQAALRSILADHLGKLPPDVQLARSSKGKPWCRDESSIGFNMSHADRKSMIAFARGQEIGVDLELIRDMKDLEGLIRKSLCPGEVQQLASDGPQRREGFFRFWTIKESYLKAIGEGMRLSPEKLEFRIRRGEVELLAAPYPFGEDRPVVREIFSHEGYAAAVSFERSAVRILEKKIESAQLLRWAQEVQEHGSNENL